MTGPRSTHSPVATPAPSPYPGTRLLPDGMAHGSMGHIELLRKIPFEQRTEAETQLVRAHPKLGDSFGVDGIGQFTWNGYAWVCE